MQKNFYSDYSKMGQRKCYKFKSGSRKLSVNSSYSVVHDVVNNFYSYGIHKEDGNKLDRNFLRIIRQANNFSSLTKTQ